MFELTKKKRQEFIHKLCHRYREFLSLESIYQESKKFPEPKLLCDTMRAFGVSRKCYVFLNMEILMAFTLI